MEASSRLGICWLHLTQDVKYVSWLWLRKPTWLHYCVVQLYGCSELFCWHIIVFQSDLQLSFWVDISLFGEWTGACKNPSRSIFWKSFFFSFKDRPHQCLTLPVLLTFNLFRECVCVGVRGCASTLLDGNKCWSPTCIMEQLLWHLNQARKLWKKWMYWAGSQILNSFSCGKR